MELLQLDLLTPGFVQLSYNKSNVMYSQTWLIPTLLVPRLFLVGLKTAGLASGSCKKIYKTMTDTSTPL